MQTGSSINIAKKNVAEKLVNSRKEPASKTPAAAPISRQVARYLPVFRRLYSNKTIKEKNDAISFTERSSCRKYLIIRYANLV